MGGHAHPPHRQRHAHRARRWSVLLLAPAAAILAAGFAGEPLLAHWTQTFMGKSHDHAAGSGMQITRHHSCSDQSRRTRRIAAARFIMQFFPIFLLGALVGKLMEDSGSVSAIAGFMTESPRRAVLSVVLAGAAVTYGGVSLFVAFFVLAPMAHALFRAAAIPRRLMPAAIVLGTSTFTMSALPGTPAIQNAKAFLDTHASNLRNSLRPSRDRRRSPWLETWWADRHVGRRRVQRPASEQHIEWSAPERAEARCLGDAAPEILERGSSAVGPAFGMAVHQ